MTSTQQSGNGRTRQPGHQPGQQSAAAPSIPLSPDHPVPFADHSIGHLVREATTHLSTLIRSEVELAKAEVVAEIRKAIRGSVYFVVALTILLFSLFFLFLMIGEVLDIWLPRSAAFAIVFAAMLLAAALFGMLGYLRVRSIRRPERTISAVRDTAALAKRRAPERNAEHDGEHDAERNGVDDARFAG